MTERMKVESGADRSQKKKKNVAYMEVKRGMLDIRWKQWMVEGQVSMEAMMEEQVELMKVAREDREIGGVRFGGGIRGRRRDNRGEEKEKARRRRQRNQRRRWRE
jgi:hypothetical protein